MIDRLKNIIAKAKYLTLTIADQGDQVQITATVRPKDGSEPAKPIQVKADWQIADTLLVEALNKPPKAGKTEVKKPEKKAEEEAGDLFSGANMSDGSDLSDESDSAEAKAEAPKTETTEVKEESHE